MSEDTNRVITTIQYTKLRNGTWGLRGPLPPPAPLAAVTVTKKDGKTRTETVAKIVWQGNGIWIGSLVAKEAGASTSTPRSTTNAPPRRTAPPSYAKSYRPASPEGGRASGDFECPACGEHVQGSSTCPATGNPH